MRTVRVIVVLGSLGLLPAGAAAADASPEPPPDVACRLQGGAGKVALAGGPRGLVIDLTGVGNQGGLTLSFKHSCPDRLTFRFANLRGMQSFTLTDGKQTYRADTEVGGGKKQTRCDRAGRWVGGAAEAAVVFDVQATPAGHFEVVVTTRGLRPGGEWTAGWMQYFRRKGFADS
jgi:hypothetical protein